MIRTVEIDLVGRDGFPIDVTAHYSGKYDESEVKPPENLDVIIRNFALDVMVPCWIKQIQDACIDMEYYNMPAEWQTEDADDFDC